ncbi:hypothetical protein C5D08_06830 [Rathayibacter sp. AY1B6]|nr:hypothetical protein C5D08_06830 [Rathayibacter sp. AY1B6]
MDSHGSGTRQPSRPTSTPPLRKKVGSCRSASGTRIAAALVNLLDVSLLVVGGALASSAGPLLAEVSDRLASHVHAPVPRLLPSTLGDRAVALGAVRAGLDRVRADPLALRLPERALDARAG